MSSPNRIALLRGINVGGHNKVPMAGLRTLCEGLGWQGVRTYIASGNVVFGSAEAPGDCANQLRQAIRDSLGLDIPVTVRTAGQWQAILAANPFPGAANDAPKFLHAGFSVKPLAADLEARLAPSVGPGERMAVAGGVLWGHFGNGVGRSKLTPAVLDRCAGSPVTARNWNTLCKLSNWITV